MRMNRNTYLSERVEIKKEVYVRYLTKSRSPLSLSSLVLKVWPLHPLALVVPIFLSPSSFLNRGYTIWFHWITLGFLLTQSDFLRRFLVVQGTSISIGWYAALCNDYICHSAFFHILYQNMPTIMVAAMTNESGELIYNPISLLVMLFSNVIDLILHPGITFCMWKWHCASGGNIHSLLTWDVVISSYCLSRFWSIVHVYYNMGSFGMFYFGYDVYNIDNLDSWLPAYLMEGAFYATILCWKIGRELTTHRNIKLS